MVEISKVLLDWVELLITKIFSFVSEGTSVVAGTESSGWTSGCGAVAPITQLDKVIASSKMSEKRIV
jgi:hypothetical protein